MKQNYYTSTLALRMPKPIAMPDSLCYTAKYALR
jgi:hypothetical protein